MLTSITLFLASRLGRYVFTGGVLVALVVSFAAHQRRIGAKDAVAEIRQNTGVVVNAGKSAGAKSLSGSGGVQLPYRD